MQETGTPAGSPRVCEGCRGGKFRPDHTPMVLTGETREMREIATPAGSPSVDKAHGRKSARSFRREPARIPLMTFADRRT